LAILSLSLNSCGNVKSKKEIILREYTLEKIKGYLKGDWIDSAQEQSDRSHPTFWRFDYESASGGTFQDYQWVDNKLIAPTCRPVFKIYKFDGHYQIEFVAMFMKKPEKLAIELISTQRLVFLQNGKTMVFRKITLKEDR
jgi:hypothetical protein